MINCVDIVIMEIISYNDIGRGRKNFNFKLALNMISQKKAVYRPLDNTFGEKLYRKNNYSSKSVAFDVKKLALSMENILSNAFSYLWLIPVIALLCVVPFAVKGLVDYSESFAKPVEMSLQDVNDFDSLDLLMSEFALEKFANFDENGNLLSEDGNVVSTNVNYKSAVTWTNYTIRNGDTISGITYKFGLTNISTLIAVNGVSNVRSIRVGQKIRIPSYDGLIHEVASGETLKGISNKYKVSIEDILDVNDLESDVILKGENLFIPGAKMDQDSLKKAMGELFAYPIKISYRLSSRFGKRKDPISGVDSSHTGIDMACATGTNIFASLSGTVAYTGYSSVYGNYVIINHFDGYQTLYAHMSKILCKKGDYVNQGTRIGLVGNTGYSTGPHLHFSVYKNGKLVDPLILLKK